MSVKTVELNETLVICYYNNHRRWKASFNNPRIIGELRYARKTKQYCSINLG